MDAFKTAQALEPSAQREKASGFVLFVGAGPNVIEAGADREVAIEKAVEIIKETDTIVFLSKLQSKFGEVYVTKDQLVLHR
jgi:UDP-N-acetylmuramyl tripeptide synthase